MSVSKLLLKAGAKDIIICDTAGVIYKGREKGMNPFKRDIAEITNLADERGDLQTVMRGADMFLGLSVPGTVNQEMVRNMASNPIIFALANPIPEIMPDEAYAAGAKVMATGRSDFPNQVNNSLAFPGIFRGALDVRAREINDDMKIAAAHAIAELITEEQLAAGTIIPSALDFHVPPAVASDRPRGQSGPQGDLKGGAAHAKSRFRCSRATESPLFEPLPSRRLVSAPRARLPPAPRSTCARPPRRSSAPRRPEQ